MKLIIRTGIAVGLISGLWLLVCFSVVNWINSQVFHHAIPASQIRSYSGLFSLLILIFGVYFGIKETKRQNKNVITFGQAAKAGIGISIITAILVSLFTLLYCLVINPGYADFMVRETRSELLSSGMSSQQISIQLQKVQQQFSTASQVMMALIGQLVIGSLASCIISFFVRTKHNK